MNLGDFITITYALWLSCQFIPRQCTADSSSGTPSSHTGGTRCCVLTFGTTFFFFCFFRFAYTLVFSMGSVDQFLKMHAWNHAAWPYPIVLCVLCLYAHGMDVHVFCCCGLVFLLLIYWVVVHAAPRVVTHQYRIN